MGAARATSLCRVCLLSCLAALLLFPFVGRAAEEEGWIPLFNGKDLNDWQVKITGYDLGDNFGDTFRVEDGVMKVCYEHYEAFDGRFGHIFYKTPFNSYRFEWNTGLWASRFRAGLDGLSATAAS